jgi:hypothetical protein
MDMSDQAVETVKNFASPIVGCSSEVLLVLGDNETSQIVRLVPTALLYWICTSYAREKRYRAWCLGRDRERPPLDIYRELARKFPHGLSDLPALPEEELLDRERDKESERAMAIADR